MCLRFWREHKRNLSLTRAKAHTDLLFDTHRSFWHGPTLEGQRMDRGLVGAGCCFVSQVLDSHGKVVGAKWLVLMAPATHACHRYIGPKFKCLQKVKM